MTAAWPSSLPEYVLEQGFSEALSDQLLETSMEAGRSKTRRRYSSAARPYTIAVAMTLAQRLTFEGWFEDDLQGGSLPFTWVHPLHRTVATFRFRKPVPKFTVRGNAHIAAFALELLPTAAVLTAPDERSFYDFYFDFKTQQYWQDGAALAALTDAQGWSVSGGVDNRFAPDTTGAPDEFDSGVTPINGYGMHLYSTKTNLLLNAGQDVDLTSQSVTVSAVPHTLLFTGTGTVTLTGASTAGPLVGTGANNQVALNFTPSAGSLTLTRSGTVRFAALFGGTTTVGAPHPVVQTAGASVSMTAITPVWFVRNDYGALFDNYVYETVVNLTAGGTSFPLGRLDNPNGASNCNIWVQRNSGNTARLLGQGNVQMATLGSGITTGKLAAIIRMKNGLASFGIRHGGSTLLSGETASDLPTDGVSRWSPNPQGNYPNSPLEHVAVREGSFDDDWLTARLLELNP